MTKKDLLILRKAAKILKRDPLAKSCKTYAWGCGECRSAQLIKEFDSFVNFWLESDEQIEKYFKDFNKTKKKLKKKNSK